MNKSDRTHPPGREAKAYGTGFSDGLEPLEALDLRKCNTVSELVNCMGKTAFGGRTVGEAADLLYDMAADKDVFTIMTMSGAMTIAKMGLVICDMIETGMVQAVVSTGALITHGLTETMGMRHFKYRPGQMNDENLYFKGYDRVYDTLELEKNLDDTEKVVHAIFKAEQPEKMCSRSICESIGKHLHKNMPGRGVLKTAYEYGVPVYIPAFTDSELGLDVSIYKWFRRMNNEVEPQYDPFLDLDDLTERFIGSRKQGIFTIGGGVPRNWAQQIAPYIEIRNMRLGMNRPIKRYQFGIRICPEPAHWGGLSGCTYSEGVSWGKFVPISKGGRFVEVISDATIAWPMIVKAVMERMEKTGTKSKNKLKSGDDK